MRLILLFPLTTPGDEGTCEDRKLNQVRRRDRQDRPRTSDGLSRTLTITRANVKRTRSPPLVPQEPQG